MCARIIDYVKMLLLQKSIARDSLGNLAYIVKYVCTCVRDAESTIDDVLGIEPNFIKPCSRLCIWVHTFT